MALADRPSRNRRALMGLSVSHALPVILDGIDQDRCDEMGARLAMISTVIEDTARRMQTEEGTAAAYAVPLHFTKAFTIIAAISRDDVRGKSVLDVGCGGGAFMAQALHLGMAPTGVDIYSGQAHSRAAAEKLLEAAGMPAAEIAVSVRDADITRSLGDLQERFDFVASSGMLEHIPDKRLRIAAVQNMIRALKPGGTLLLECAPNARLPIDLFHYGPRYPFYHLLPDAVKRVYMRWIIRPRRPDLNEVQSDPDFLNGVSVVEIKAAIRSVDAEAEIVQAFPLLTRLAVSKSWLRRPRVQSVTGLVSRLLVRLDMEPLILIVASRSPVVR